MDQRLILGAALKIPFLEMYRDWMLEKPRDLELQDFISPNVLNGDWQSLVDQAKRLIDGFEGRIGIHGPFIGFSLKETEAEIQNFAKKTIDTGLEICRALGGTHMVLHSPYSIWDHYNWYQRTNIQASITEACHAILKDALKKAEDIGCTIVIENIEDLDPAYRLELINSFASNALALSIDTGHAHFSHSSLGAPPVDYFVASAGYKLAHVHIQDTDGHADRHWVPGQGTVPWHAVFRALAKLESQPRLIIELADLNRVSDAAKWLTSQELAQ